MALVAPSSLVAAPARAPLPYGLGSALGWRAGDRFGTGVAWVGVTCDPAGGRGGPECDPLAVVGLPKEFTGERAMGEATPFVVYGHDTCQVIGSSFEESQQMATDHLLAREEARAEQALWTGDLGNVPNFAGANGYPAPVSAGVHDLEWHALAAVEDMLARVYGSLGTIHMSRRTASLLLSKGALDRSGGRLYTELGTPVVAGAGYPDEQSIIGTAALFGYRGEAFTSSTRPGDLFDRALNQMYAVAEREYVIGFDPCPVVKATYTGELNNPPADPLGSPALVLSIGTLPASPIPDGTDVTVTVQSSMPVDEVNLWYRINGGAWVDNGEMTEVNAEEFVENLDGTLANPGDTFDLYGKSGATTSPTITIEVT